MQKRSPAATAVAAPRSSRDRLKHAEIARPAPRRSESCKRGASRGALAFTAVLCVLKQGARLSAAHTAADLVCGDWYLSLCRCGLRPVVRCKHILIRISVHAIG